MKMYMIWVFMHDVDLFNYMVKVLLEINEVVLSYYVDIWFGCNVLWSHDRFTKYVWGYGALHLHCTSRLRLGAWVRSYKVQCEVKISICAYWLGVHCNVLLVFAWIWLCCTILLWWYALSCVGYTYTSCGLMVIHCTKYP